MNKKEQIELVKAYVALSNTHRIDLILPLLSEEILYRSTSVGEFVSKSAVKEMMNNFFTRFPDVYWDVKDYKHSDAQTVSFDFVMTARDIDSNELIERAGLEKIVFSDSGLINKIEVITR